MPITVDDELLASPADDLRTVGDLLTFVQRDDRMVVQILIDGSEPKLSETGLLRHVRLAGHTVYVETANPRRLGRMIFGRISEEPEKRAAG